MIKVIRAHNLKSMDKYEVKVGDRIRIHEKYKNISTVIRDAVVNYPEDTVFEVVYADIGHFHLRVLSTNEILNVNFVQRSNNSYSSYRFSQNYTLVKDNMYTLKDVAL